jgi:hypothetical protein
MSSTVSSLKRREDAFISTMKRMEEPIVRFAGRSAERFAEYTPERPGWAFLKRVPTMTELVENQLTFRKQLVEEQHAFVRKMMKAMRPMLTKLDHPAEEKPVTKPAAVRRTGGRAA